MASEGTVLLMTTYDDGEAEIVRQLLHAYGIPAQVVSDITHSIAPFTMDGLGEIRIFVATDRLDEAREILAEHRRQGLSAVEGGEEPEPDGSEGPEGGPARP